MDQKRIIKKYRLKEGVKTVVIITCIYLLFICYLLAAEARINGLNQNSYTAEGHNKTIQLFTR